MKMGTITPTSWFERWDKWKKVLRDASDEKADKGELSRATTRKVKKTIEEIQAESDKEVLETLREQGRI